MKEILSYAKQTDKVWLIDLRKDEDNMTALHLATLNNHIDMVKLLISCTDPNAKCTSNQTPLHFAVARLNYEMALLILSMSAKKVDVNIQDNEGNTPLHFLLLMYSILNVKDNSLSSVIT